MSHSEWLALIGLVAGVLTILTYIALLIRRLERWFKSVRRVASQHQQMVAAAHVHGHDGLPVPLFPPAPPPAQAPPAAAQWPAP